jgi:putative nucleotidyltransferase with HDIG domain
VHSVVTAIISEEAARVARLDCEVAYTTALLHNLGTLGLMSAYPDEYSRMLEVSNDFGFDLLRTERDLFEIDHCAAGAYIALDWQFPDQLAAAIATHHDEPVPNVRSLDNLIKVSWRLTDTLGYAAFSPAKDGPTTISQSTFRTLPIPGSVNPPSPPRQDWTPDSPPHLCERYTRKPNGEGWQPAAGGYPAC